MTGEIGYITIPTKGEDGPGEALFGKKGAWIVWSSDPLKKGKQVIVTAERGGRTLTVQSTGL